MNLQKCAGKETTFDPNFKCSIERLKHLISSNKFSTLTQTKPGQRVLEIACFSCLTQNNVQKIQPTVYKESCVNFFQLLMLISVKKESIFILGMGQCSEGKPRHDPRSCPHCLISCTQESLHNRYTAGCRYSGNQWRVRTCGNRTSTCKRCHLGAKRL